MLLQPKLFPRIFGNYSGELCTLDIIKNLSQWTYSVLFAAYLNTLITDVLTNGEVIKKKNKKEKNV